MEDFWQICTKYTTGKCYMWRLFQTRLVKTIVKLLKVANHWKIHHVHGNFSQQTQCDYGGETPRKNHQ